MLLQGICHLGIGYVQKRHRTGNTLTKEGNEFPGRYGNIKARLWKARREKAFIGFHRVSSAFIDTYVWGGQFYWMGEAWGGVQGGAPGRILTHFHLAGIKLGRHVGWRSRLRRGSRDSSGFGPTHRTTWKEVAKERIIGMLMWTGNTVDKNDIFIKLHFCSYSVIFKTVVHTRYIFISVFQ